MTTETETIHDLLRDLVASFIDHPHALELSAKEVPGACYWSMRGHAQDQPKLVGKKGSHVQALTLLVKALGSASGSLYAFQLLEPEVAVRRENQAPQTASVYDADPAKELLTRLIENLSLGDFEVESDVRTCQTGFFSLSVLLNIVVRTQEDYEALTVAPTPDGLTLVAALGTLFRGAGNKQGVRINLEVLRA